ncbi:hypothetical protein C8J57DRAFT_1224259 [Mycena rebaudengoi]|nr:hypothetical protein C8J57DRAFT_1224259 [Mycena rebaudengoi]
MTEGLNQDSKSPANIKSLSQEVHQSGKLGELGHLVNCRLTVSALSIIHVWSCHITIGRAGRAGPPTSSRRCAVPRHGATCARRAPASGARGGLGGGFGACHPARPRALRGMRDSTRWSTSAVWAHPAQDVLDRAGTSKQGGTGGGRRQSSYLAVDLPQPNMANADISSSPSTLAWVIRQRAAAEIYGLGNRTNRNNIGANTNKRITLPTDWARPSPFLVMVIFPANQEVRTLKKFVENVRKVS